MINLLRAEMFKIIRNRSFFWLNILMVFFAGFVILLAVLDNYGLLDHVDNITVEADSEIVFSGIDFFLYLIEGPELFFIYFYIAVLGTFFIANEYSFAMKNIIATGYARWKIYLAKLLAFIFGTLVIFSVLLLSSFLLGSMTFGVGEWPDGQSIVHIGKTLILIVLLIVSIVSIVMVFSTVATTYGLSLVVSVIAYFVLRSGLGMLGHRYQFANSAMKYSVFERFSGAYEQAAQTNTLIESSIVAIVTMIIAMVIGITLFHKKDIT